MIHPDLSEKYRNGYAKNGTGWPLSAELTNAAAGHTAFMVSNVQNMAIQRIEEGFRWLPTAKTVMLMADLKGNVLSVSGRVAFQDAAAANKAQNGIQHLFSMMSSDISTEIEAYAKSDPSRSENLATLRSVTPIIQQAHRALNEAKVETAGSDVILSGNCSADFDIGKLVANAAQEIHEAIPRVTAQNNLKQIVSGLTHHESANNYIPIHGIGPKDRDGKPLLSWRVAILPYIEQKALYMQFKLDESWDSEHNKKLIDKMPKVFAPANKSGQPGYTHMQMVIGPSAMRLAFEGLPPDYMVNRKRQR